MSMCDVKNTPTYARDFVSSKLSQICTRSDVSIRFIGDNDNVVLEFTIFIQ